MKPKLRNHLASLCLHYVNIRHATDFHKLIEITEENYADGSRSATLGADWKKFAEWARNERIKAEGGL